ncbi:hypothetical protein GBA52_026339 [Prunus armeniaca]|nr:hypothetical protein GBA52_026339 [Prunus armeniaca]
MGKVGNYPALVDQKPSIFRPSKTAFQETGIEEKTFSSLESFKLVSGIDEDISHLNITGEKLQDIDISWRNVSSSSSTSLNILAPNLKNFK